MAPSRILPDAELQADVFEAVQRALEPYLSCFPSWVVELNVGYDPKDDGQGWSNAQHEYRRHRINIGAQFLTLSEAGRRDVIRHEIVHAHVAPLLSIAREYAGLLVERETETMRRIVEARVTEALEATVSDLSEAFRQTELTETERESDRRHLAPSRRISPGRAPGNVSGTKSA